jgi:AraC-like DNA-binding protein
VRAVSLTTYFEVARFVGLDPIKMLRRAGISPAALLLPAGRATLEQVGENLGLHPRALQRLLEREGRTFATLLNEVRRELALRYLSSSTHQVTAIAQMTGYAAPSSFTRWFCAEFGVAPALWRAEERQAQAESP